MPLIDVLEGIGNPEAYISRAIRDKDSDEEGKVNRDLYGAGYLGRSQPTIQPGRGMLGSMLQGVGILNPPDPRGLSPYEELLYTSGKQAREDRGYEEQKRGAELGQFNTQNKQGNLVNILKIAAITGIPPEELMQGNPEAGDDVQAYLTERTMDKDREAEKDMLGEELTRAQIAHYGKINQPPEDRDLAGRNIRTANSFFSSPLISQQAELYITQLNEAARYSGKDPDRARKATLAAQGIAKRITDSAISAGVNRANVESQFIEMDNLAMYKREYAAGQDPRMVTDKQSYDEQWKSNFLGSTGPSSKMRSDFGQ